MAYKYDPSTWTNGVTIPSVTDFQNIASDIHTSGSTRDSSAYGSANNAFLTLNPAELPGTSHAVTAGSWGSGTATLTIGAHSIATNQRVRIAGITPSGYNSGSDSTVVTAVTATAISYALVSNPGAWSSGGTVLTGPVSPSTGMLAMDQNLNVKAWNGTAWVSALTTSSAVPYYAPYYAFSLQPGGSLSIGSNTVTLTPVPLGLNGSDVGHSVYLSNGTGTAEAVLITGGTAVSGASSGTITFTCVNTHSGAWTVSSASAGIQEALNAMATSGGTLVLPAGTSTMRATITVNTSGVTVVGAGMYSTILARTGDYGDTFFIKQQVGLRFANFQVQQTINYVAGTPGTASNLPTNGAHFNLKGVNHVRFDDMRFQDMASNVSITGGVEIFFVGCSFAGTYDSRSSAPKATVASLILQPNDGVLGIPTWIRVIGCDFVGNNNGTTNTTTNYAGVGAAVGIWIFCGEDFEMIGGYMGGQNLNNVNISATTSGSSPLLNHRFIGVRFDSAGGPDFTISGDGTHNASDVTINSCQFNGEIAGHNAVYVVNASSGVAPVYGLNISNNNAFAYYDSPFYLQDGLGVIVTGNLVYDYNLAGNSSASLSSGIAIGGRCSKFKVSTNMVGGGLSFEDYNGTTNKCLFGITAASLGSTNVGTISNNSAPNGASSIGTASDLVFLQETCSSTFANLPPTPPLGSYSVVSDSNTTTWGANVAGSGSNKVLAFYNGTAWTVAGK